jgi:hypothetical protein
MTLDREGLWAGWHGIARVRLCMHNRYGSTVRVAVTVLGLCRRCTRVATPDTSRVLSVHRWSSAVRRQVRCAYLNRSARACDRARGSKRHSAHSSATSSAASVSIPR